MLVLAFLILGFAMLDALCGLDLVWLHPTPIRPCLDVTIWEASPNARLLRAYPSLFHSMRCYAYHVCLRQHLYTLAHMSMHESCLLVCHPCLNTTKLWTFNPNLHLSFADTTFCLLAFLFLCLLSCFFACHVHHAYLLYASFICSMHLFLSIACLLVSFSCLCMYTHGARTHEVRAWSPKCKKKGRGCKHVDISQVAMFNRFKGLVSPICLCTLLNPLSSAFLSLLDRLY